MRIRVKILHTSDWHLGQYFMIKSRQCEHLSFLNWLIETVATEKVDVIIVAGDVFDSASPPSYARKLYSDFIVKLQSTGCTQLIIVSGNHDSVAVLNESKNLLKSLNVSVLAGLSEDLSDHLIILKNKQQQDAVLVCALPFLRATDLVHSEFGLSVEQKQMNLQRAIQSTYQKIYQLAKAHDSTLPIVATGHLTALGCAVSDSVREIYIGTLSAFPATLFPDFDYIALGHLHRAQKVQNKEHIQYCGSPIALSFDESKHAKKVLIVQIEQNKLLDICALDIPCTQQLQVISGDLDAIKLQLQKLKEKNTAIWLEIKLKDRLYLSDVQTQLNDLVEDSALEILKISAPMIDENKQWQAQHIDTLETLTPQELFVHRLDAQNDLNDAQKLKLEVLFAQACAELETKS